MGIEFRWLTPPAKFWSALRASSESRHLASQPGTGRRSSKKFIRRELQLRQLEERLHGPAHPRIFHRGFGPKDVLALEPKSEPALLHGQLHERTVEFVVELLGGKSSARGGRIHEIQNRSQLPRRNRFVRDTLLGGRLSLERRHAAVQGQLAITSAIDRDFDALLGSPPVGAPEFGDLRDRRRGRPRPGALLRRGCLPWRRRRQRKRSKSARKEEKKAWIHGQEWIVRGDQYCL